METIHISTLSENLKNGHTEKTPAGYCNYGVSTKSITYYDAESDKLYLVISDLKGEILNIQNVECA